MSLLDNVINAATSAISGNGEQSQAMQLVSQLIQQNGGNVGELLGKYRRFAEPVATRRLGRRAAKLDWYGQQRQRGRIANPKRAGQQPKRSRRQSGLGCQQRKQPVGAISAQHHQRHHAQRQRRRCQRLWLGRHRPHRDAKLFEINPRWFSGCLIGNG